MKGPCPRCRVALVEHQTKSTLLSGCLTCGGIFLDHATRGRVVTELDQDVVQAAGLAASHARHQPDVHAKADCPACGAAMTIQKLASGVTIDVCNAHGAWFDRDELPQLVAALTAMRKPAPTGAGNGALLAAGAVGVVAVGTAAVVAHEASSSVSVSSSGADVSGLFDVAGSVLEIGFDVLGALFD
ncbi:MAG: zf-TFIIB domain-containing protein [Myxococcales bacterium]|nr:zf-TFIIB domain-containing protein [Myxococcales bacterium]